MVPDTFLSLTGSEGKCASSAILRVPRCVCQRKNRFDEQSRVHPAQGGGWTNFTGIAVTSTVVRFGRVAE